MMVKQSQSSRNSKFAMSLQYFKKKKKVRDEVNFLHADKLGMEFIFCMQINISHQVSIIVFDRSDQICPSVAAAFV